MHLTVNFRQLDPANGLLTSVRDHVGVAAAGDITDGEAEGEVTWPSIGALVMSLVRRCLCRCSRSGLG
jgi:hypothetical protein